MKSKSWKDRSGEVYVGHEVLSKNECKCVECYRPIYVGGPHYSDHAQIHLSVKQAKFIVKTLTKAIERAEK